MIAGSILPDITTNAGDSTPVTSDAPLGINTSDTKTMTACQIWLRIDLVAGVEGIDTEERKKESEYVQRKVMLWVS